MQGKPNENFAQRSDSSKLWAFHTVNFQPPGGTIGHHTIAGPLDQWLQIPGRRERSFRGQFDPLPALKAGICRRTAAERLLAS